MLPLSATIVTDQRPSDGRRSVRRTLRLEVPAYFDRYAQEATIRDLSERGLQIETSANLEIGGVLLVDLPHAGATKALVVWKRGLLFGCEFISPVSRATVSAALLQSPILEPVLRAPEHSQLGLVEASIERSALEGAVLLVSIFVALVAALAFIAALLWLPFGSTT